jgi:MFS family permease
MADDQSLATGDSTAQDLSLGALLQRQTALEDVRRRAAYGQYLALVGAISSPFILYAVFRDRSAETLSDQWSRIAVLYSLLGLVLFFTTRSRGKELEGQLRTLEFEIDLLRYEVNPEQTRAEKVLRLNQYELSRYYSLNLSQNFWVFALGVFCILLGLAVIGLTLYLVIYATTETETQIIIAVVGALGSFMTSYIAAIYLKIHGEASTHLGSFHGRLVQTHQLLLGNLVASRIENEEKRSETLSQLALNMTKTP